MKIRYFKFIEIEKEIIQEFINKHPAMKDYVDIDKPFYVRVSKKPYSGLIHTIISEKETSEQVIIKWNQLNDFARKVCARKISKMSLSNLENIVGKEKAEIISNITKAVMDKSLDLKQLINQPTQVIIDTLVQYRVDVNTAKTFAIFGCFKQDVLCEYDPDFKTGLQLFLKKKDITQEDIKQIRIEYQGQETLFSLWMWKIKNERVGK